MINHITVQANTESVHELPCPTATSLTFKLQQYGFAASPLPADAQLIPASPPPTEASAQPPASAPAPATTDITPATTAAAAATTVTATHPPAEGRSPLSAIAMVLQDIAEVADAAGGVAMEVFLDERAHGTQSLLQPGLAGMQGPALCVRIPGDAHGALVIGRRDLGIVGFTTVRNAHVIPLRV